MIVSRVRGQAVRGVVPGWRVARDSGPTQRWRTAPCDSGCATQTTQTDGEVDRPLAGVRVIHASVASPGPLRPGPAASRPRLAPPLPGPGAPRLAPARRASSRPPRLAPIDPGGAARKLHSVGGHTYRTRRV